MLASFDATAVLNYFPESMDTSRSLWFCRDMLDVDALRDNAVCLAVDDFEELTSCRDFFRAFPSVFLAMSDADLCETVSEALSAYIPGLVILTPNKSAFRGFGCVRDVMLAGGREAVERLMIGAIEQEMPGLLDLADIERVNQDERPYVLSGFDELDRSIGGFYGGELSVWTGKRGGGKSTLLGQILLEAVDMGQRVCAYSGELPAWRFKQWLSLQAAGPENIVERQDRFTGHKYFTVKPDVQEKIDEWWRSHFFLYDNAAAGGSSADSIVSLFEYAVRRHGCAVFLVDNLMTARFSTSRDTDFYRDQSNFVGRLVEFAKRYEVHVHLVAHPRKAEGARALVADDVGGSSGVTDRADNVFALERLDESASMQTGYDTALRILKNRNCGATGVIGMMFDPAARRFYRGANDKKYKWGGSEASFTELPAETYFPF